MKRILNTPDGERLWRQSLAMVTTMFYLGLALAPVAARASDTEVYAGVITASPDMSPTLMMQLDSGKTVTADGGARFKAFKNVMQRVLFGYTTMKDMDGDGVDEEVVTPPIPGFVRMGYSRYQVKANDGGWVRYPPRRLDAFIGFNSEPVVSAPTVSSDDAELRASGITLAGLQLDMPSDFPAVRFPAVMVPRGATIDSAYIELTPYADGTPPGQWIVTAEDSDNAATYTSSDTATSRPYIPAIKVDNPAPWVLNDKYQVPVTSLVQDIADRTGWCGGNAMAFKLENSATLQAFTWDSDPAKAARLVVSYSLTDPVKLKDTCLESSFNMTLTPGSGLADMEKGVAATNPTLAFAQNELAFRFEPGLAKDAIIDEARLFLTGQATGALKPNGDQPEADQVPKVLASLFDTVSLAAFCSSPTSCTFPTDSKTATTTWNPRKSGSKYVLANKEAISIDLTAQAQALVKTAGWTTASALGIHMRPDAITTSSAKIHAYETPDAGYRPQLTIKGKQRFTDLSKQRTVRDEIWAELQIMEPSTGGTPLGDAYQETMRYMMGTYASHMNTGADPRVLTTATRTLTGTDRQFATPISSTNQCAAHYVFVLASGELPNMSNVSQHTSGLVTDPTAEVQSCDTAAFNTYFTKSSPDTPTSDRTGWACMFSTANWGIEETRNQRRALVKTSTVLFDKVGEVAPGVKSNLQKLADVGGKGGAYTAENEDELTKAIMDTVNKLMAEEGTITAPGVAVNQLNRLNNLDQLYYALFKPTDGINWEGNVKRYRLSLTEYAATPESDVGIYDLKNKPAVDERGFFHSTARSWWLPDTETKDDGNLVSLGGFAARLPALTSRKMFALIGGSVRSIHNAGTLDSDVVAKVQALNGLATSGEATNLLNWYRGYNITGTPLPSAVVDVTTATQKDSLRVGGVLHSRPILVNYGFTGTAAEALIDPDKQLNTLFFSTLDGTLHAVEAKSGEEELTFIPEEKLGKLKVLYDNRTRTAPDDLNPEFGMDSTWSVYRKEVAGQLEKVYLYGGMRMGGSNYYALDMTDKSNPSLLFKLQGGSGSFSDMGQSWSQPVVTTMRVAGTVKPVLVFGGGYDAAKYEVGGPTYPATGLGNQVYIVDAESGALITKVTDAEMDSSIPSQLKIADIDGDGLVDHIYFGDLGGKVFRLDVDNKSSTASGLVKRVKLLATLADVSNERRFYEPPTVALFKGADNKLLVAIGMGSGNRSHPLNKDVDDRFHVLFDRDVTRLDVLTAADSVLQPTIGASDLADASGTVDLSNTKGWYLDMTGSGEKVITSAVFLRNQLVWSSYSPDQTAGSDCAPVIGRSFLYRADISAGFPSGKILKTDSVYGLGADPQVIILENQSDATKSDIGIVTGTDVELEATGISAGLQRTRWYEKKKQ